MYKYLVITESTAKAKALQHLLGENSKAVSTHGCLREMVMTGKELPDTDFDGNFVPKYKVPEEKKKLVSELRELIAESGKILLAYEATPYGEYLAWNFTQVFEGVPAIRIMICEMDWNGIECAVRSGRAVNPDVALSHQTRMIIERVCQARISRFMKKKGAKYPGFTQSSILLSIAAQEKKIAAVRKTWFREQFQLKKGIYKITMPLSALNGKKAVFDSHEEAQETAQLLEQQTYTITSIQHKRPKTSAPAPFNLESLLLEASAAIGFTAERTMKAARRLFDGITLEDGTYTGLVTSFFTDSTELSMEYGSLVQEQVKALYGSDYLRRNPVFNTAGPCQSGCLAIVPTDPARVPESIKELVNPDMYRLYSLIYARTLASVMNDASYDSPVVSASSQFGRNEEALLKVQGLILRREGFFKAYSKYQKPLSVKVPSTLKEGDELKADKFQIQQMPSAEPFDETTLLAQLISEHIGDPREYAECFALLNVEGFLEYVAVEIPDGKKKKVFTLSETGSQAAALLEKYFSGLFDEKNRMMLRGLLDDIAQGKAQPAQLLKRFNEELSKTINAAYKDNKGLKEYAYKNLVIVESPSKAKTIEKYLGNGYKVVSSKGHVRDLALAGKERLGIDIENNFEPIYSISKDKQDLVEELQDLADNSEQVILSSDPDREGEAIAWHLAAVLNIPEETAKRVTFHEITKNVVTEAMKDPGAIDMNLVHSQESRRMLDRIIGFKLSRLLSKKIHSRSAGRVQSVALLLIVEREQEIRAFVPEEYWSIEAEGKKDSSIIKSELTKVAGKKPEIKNQQQADAIIDSCKGKPFMVSEIKETKKKRSPKLPFTTSTMQQEASTKLGFGAKRTMQVAQRLYEGITLPNGTTTGLITYMRTDSTRLSPEFVKTAENQIEQVYGSDYKGTAHQKNSKNAQDAHEAIRPTDIHLTPDSIKSSLSQEQYRLYSLVYWRTMASLMADAVLSVKKVLFDCGDNTFTASGQTMVFDGYTKAYGRYEKITENELPVLAQNDELSDVHIRGSQHFTQPPERYSEAKLIKKLEESSIGRPSTYATIIDTLQARGYVELTRLSDSGKTKYFIPTEQGELTTEKLSEYFNQIINVQYTAEMENQLDKIAEGDEDYVQYLEDFYDDFEPLVENAYEKMPVKELEKVGRICPEDGGELVYRNGRFGKFISCINFPTCKYTESADADIPEEQQQTKPCPNCGQPMRLKKGRFGLFWACSNTECKHTEPLKKPKPTGEMCPVCGHELVERTNKRGKPFIGCSNYPNCTYIKPSKEDKDKEKDSSDGDKGRKKMKKEDQKTEQASDTGGQA